MEMGNWVAVPVIYREKKKKSFYTFWVLSCIWVLFGIDCVVAKETDRDRERARGGELTGFGWNLCLCIVKSLCVWVFCSLHHVSFPVFVSVFRVCCDSFGESEVCLCDVWTSPLTPTLPHATHGDSHICLCLFSYFFFFIILNREFPFAHHPARSNHHHHKLPRHPALSPRHHREVFYD